MNKILSSKNASYGNSKKISTVVLFVSLALAGFFGSALNASAAEFTAKFSGNWDSPTVWDLPANSSVPGAGDRVFINPGITVTVNSNSFLCQDLIFKAQTSSTTTSKLVIAPNLSLVTPFTFLVTGTITVESAVLGNNSYNTAILEGNIQAASVDVKGNKSGSDKHEAKLMVNPGGKLAVTGNITFTGGQTSNAYLDIKGNAELEIGGILNGGSGNLNFNSTSTPSSTIAFTGGPTQNIPSGGGIKYGKLKIANSMSFSDLDDRNFDAVQVIIGAGTVSVSGNIKVDKIDLAVEGGTLRMTGSNSGFSGVNASNYVKLGEDGALRIDNIGAGTGNRTTAVVFPVGTLVSNSFTPATILNTGTAQSFTLTLSDIVTKSGTTVTNNIVNKTWDITPSGTGANATINLQWNTSDEAKNLLDPSKNFNRTNCAISHWDGAAGHWEQKGVAFGSASQGVLINSNGSTTNLANSWRISRANVTSFSPFAVGDINSPLPVELKSFTAVKKENATVLTWETASEKNNKGFEVQVASDAKNFETIGSVATKNGNANYSQHYAFTDKTNRSGLVYYRLKQTDLDGSVAYYAAKVVDMGRFGLEVTAYPNPFTSRFEVKLNGAATLEATDLTGKIVFRSQVTEGTVKVDLSNQPAGVYLLKTTTNGANSINRLVKQ